MESAWSVSKLSTESFGSRRDLVANSVYAADANATKQFRRVSVGGVYTNTHRRRWRDESYSSQAGYLKEKPFGITAESFFSRTETSPVAKVKIVAHNYNESRRKSMDNKQCTCSWRAASCFSLSIDSASSSELLSSDDTSFAAGPEFTTTGVGVLVSNDITRENRASKVSWKKYFPDIQHQNLDSTGLWCFFITWFHLVLLSCEQQLSSCKLGLH